VLRDQGCQSMSAAEGQAGECQEVDRFSLRKAGWAR
jgi:hypothetical protein